MAFVNTTVVSSAKEKSVKGSVYKVALVGRMIFRKDVTSALRVLDFCNKRVARDVRKVLYAAALNAQNNHGFSDISRLYVIDVAVGKAMVLRRFRARARGRGSRVFKSYSNVIIKLGEITG